MKILCLVAILSVTGCADAAKVTSDAADSADVADMHVPRFAFAAADKATGGLSLWSDVSPTSLNPIGGEQGAWMLLVTAVAHEPWPTPVRGEIQLLGPEGDRWWSNRVTAQLAAAGNLWRLPSVYLMLGDCPLDGQLFTVAGKFDLGDGLSAITTAQIRVRFSGVCR